MRDGNTQQIVGLLKEKLNEWFNGLSPEEQANYNSLNINMLVDQLMGVGSPDSEEKNTKSDKRKIIADKLPTKQKESSF